MTTAATTHPAFWPDLRLGGRFAGTGELLRLALRRDRVVLPLWMLLLSVPLASVYIGSIATVYPSQADRAGLAASIMASPAQRALYGPVYNDSLGAVGIWKAGIFHLLIAVAVILTVIRHTRAEEETGRSELVGSAVIGRAAGLTAALLLSGGAALGTGLIGAAGLLTTDVPATGSLAFGAALAGSGLVFTAVAAVAAQLSAGARVCRGVAFAVLGAAFALRAVGDAGSGSLSWLSPLGWALQVRPYAGERWWVLLLPLLSTVVLVAVAYRLQARRDVGAGLLPDRLGPATAAPALSGVTGLTWRLDRGSVLVWTVGLVLYGLLIGSVAHGIRDELGDSAAAHDVVARLGGTTELEAAFVAAAFAMVAMAAAAFAVSLALRLHQEETGGRAEKVLAGAVSRTRWLTSHLVFAAGAPAVALLCCGVLTGLVYGVAAGDVAGKLATTVGTAAVQLPAVWLLVALTVALFGVLPRFTPAVWAVLVGFVAVYLLGSLSGVPQWLLDLEPFGHAPPVGAGFTAGALGWLLLLDGVLVAVGVLGFRHRDLRG